METRHERKAGVLFWLSAFPGGFQREAAKAVLYATLPVLSTLVLEAQLAGQQV
jgi:hypothetical protein